MIALNQSADGTYEGLAALLPTVRSIGWGAAKILQAYYRGEPLEDGTATQLQVQEGKGGPVTAADIATNHYILERMQAELPIADVGYLSEETYKSQSTGNQPLAGTWVWVIDPLDGTRDFIDKTDEYAIHMALTHQGRPILSVVVCPELGKLYFATIGGGTFVELTDGSIHPVQVSACDRPEAMTMVSSRTHRDERFNNLIARLPFQQKLYVGSVGCKVAAILEQKAEVYISLSGKSAPKDWDMAAPELILTEAGGKFTHFDGRPLLYNQGDVNQWGGLMATNGHCHSQLCEQALAILAEIDAAA